MNWVNKQTLQTWWWGQSSSKTKVVQVDFWSLEDSYAKVTVPATDVTTTSVIVVTPAWTTTTDHDPDDYQWDNVQAYATNIINWVSFDLIAHTDNQTWGKYNFNCLYT